MTLAPWQSSVLERSVQALAEGRLGHAQLLVGPPTLGTLETARALGERLLCTGASEQGLSQACGRCKSCLLLAAGSHPDWHEITFEDNPQGKKRSEITVDQLRALRDKLQLSAQLGVAVVAVIHPADAMNHSAANTLLKTLEEPQPGRYLLLVADSLSRLSATIRSRCQRTEFRLPTSVASLQWLQEQGVDAARAGSALQAARGNPGLALEWLQDEEILPLREQVRTTLQALAVGKGKPEETAAKWADSSQLPMILEFAADYALEQQRAAIANGEATVKSATTIADWFDRANQTRKLLSTTVRKDLMIYELLLRWSSL